MSRPRGFAEWNPSAASAAIVQATQRVCQEYAKYLPLTVRQVFYRLVVRSLIEKTETGYKQLGELLNRARRAQLIPFEWIRDDGAVLSGPPSYESADAVIATFDSHVDLLQIDRQRGQDRRVQVWCEAAGMVPMLLGIVAPFGVSVRSSGGFDSTSVKHQVAQELADEGPLTVLHIGDFDVSGVHVFSSLAEDVQAFAEHYGGDVQFVRIAALEEHIAEYNLPTAPPKATDRRRFDSVVTVQCEAFDPATLAKLVEQEVQSRLDGDVFEAALRAENVVRVEIRARLHS